jgi:GNAT superfamily N-acetyltransferase
VVDIRTVTADRVTDAAQIFTSSSTTNHCWCMWFIIPVKAYHAGGAAGNERSFTELAEASPTPMGLVAFDGDTPVGWCAAGPRSRFARALRTPSFGKRDSSEDDTVWFVPCFYTAKSHRRTGVGAALLHAAVELAREHGAIAIEGFPFAGDKQRSGPDLQVGVETLFAACGFEIARRPTGTRVVMRHDFTSRTPDR